MICEQPQPDVGSGDKGVVGDVRAIARRLIVNGWSPLTPSDELAKLGEVALGAAQRVFSLAADRKGDFARPELEGHFGWRETLQDSRPEEVWQLSVTRAEKDWPAEFSSELQTLVSLIQQCSQITSSVITALTDFIDQTLSRDLSTSVSPAHSFVRLLHYNSPASRSGFTEHTDLGTATIFAGETVRALELEDSQGQWITPDSEWVMAAGEILTSCTRGKVRPGRHRVGQLESERWSVAVFLHPEPGYHVGVDDQGLPLTAQAFFQRAMSAYTRKG